MEQDDSIWCQKTTKILSWIQGDAEIFSTEGNQDTLHSFLLLRMCPEQHPMIENEIPKVSRNTAPHSNMSFLM